MDHAEHFPDLDLDRTLPLRLYGDGADTTRAQHMEIMTLLPTLACAPYDQRQQYTSICPINGPYRPESNGAHIASDGVVL